MMTLKEPNSCSRVLTCGTSSEARLFSPVFEGIEQCIGRGNFRMDDKSPFEVTFPPQQRA